MFGGIFRSLASLIYPNICLCCRKTPGSNEFDKLICLECWLSIKKNAPPFCAICGRQIDNKRLSEQTCSTCQRIKLHFDRAFSPCVYEGNIKKLIHEFKYNRKIKLAKQLSKIMTQFIKDNNLPINGFDYVIPVPLHSARLREREFNQAQLLSKHISDEFGKVLCDNLLLRKRQTRTQTGLEIQARFANVSEGFKVKKNARVSAKNILLIDDVLTTGATASEAALALKEAGANKVFVLTLAS